VITGSVAILVGAIDPLEGSVLIVPGALLVMMSAFMEKARLAVLRYRTWTFILILTGVGSMWGLSAVGGIGGTSGLSWWWGLLLLPYLLGLPMAIWGPGLPRWAYWAGVVPGLWYLTIAVTLIRKPVMPRTEYPIIAALAAVSLVIIGGCAWRILGRSDK